MATALLLSLFWNVGFAHASATLLLAEPYGHLGAFNATGHSAVYLSRVCAASPLTLRRCAPDEAGAVISRYKGIGGYDWIAIPLIPYLYAVNTVDDVPLYSDPKLVAFSRNQYRRQYLLEIAPDGTNGETPEGNWVQLAGSSYDRTIYGFNIETSEQQDDELIRQYNSHPNRARYKTLSSNCADFARQVINFYHPKALRRNFIVDMGIATPKQMAKSLVKYSVRHPELSSTSFVIPQVPGAGPRSTAVHGVIESVVKSKKYLLPLAAFHPIFAGSLAVAYFGGGRFDPAKHAMIMNAQHDLESPLNNARKRSYQAQLDLLMAREKRSVVGAPYEKDWHHLEAAAMPGLDDSGKPVLQLKVGARVVDVGVARSNILDDNKVSPLAQKLIAARLREELSSGAGARTTESDVVKDWTLLQNAMPEIPGQN